MSSKLKYDLLCIEAWREDSYSWSWNEAHFLHRDIELDEERLNRPGSATARYLLKWMRDNAYLPPANGHGELTIVEYGECDFEIQRRQDAKPLFAFQQQPPPMTCP